MNEQLRLAIEAVFDLKGIDVLRNSKLFSACLSDVTERQFEREVRFLARTLDERALSLFCSAATGGVEELLLAEGKFSCILTDEYLLTPDAATRLSRCITAALANHLGFQHDVMFQKAQQTDERGWTGNTHVERTRREQSKADNAMSFNREWSKIADCVGAHKDDVSRDDLCYVGDCFYYGFDVEKDEHLALACYEASAKMGSPKAKMALGYCYSNGIGTERDYGVAMKWYEQASKAGNTDAQYALGCFSYYGYGALQDEATCKKMFGLAAKRGHKQAIEALAGKPPAEPARPSSDFLKLPKRRRSIIRNYVQRIREEAFST